MTDGFCSVCAWRPIIVKQRCRACYEYRRRHGHDRPATLITAHLDRTISPYSR